jgi:hypothetical protein
MSLLDHGNTETTKKLDFKNINLTSVGATYMLPAGNLIKYTRNTMLEHLKLFLGGGKPAVVNVLK